MSSFWYDQEVEDFRRSLETGTTNGSGPAIGTTRRQFFPIVADDGSRIHVPLNLLAETALIEVTGNCDCTLVGESFFEVLIVNGAKIPESVKQKAKMSAGHVVEKGIDRAVDNKEKAIKGSIQPQMQSFVSKQGNKIGLSQGTKKTLTKAATKIATHAAKFGIAEGVSLAAGGVGYVGLALEAESTGHAETRTGRAENGCQVLYRLTGVKPKG